MKLSWRSTRPEFDRTQTLSDQLERNARWIDSADTKAGAALVFVSAVVALLLVPLASGAEAALPRAVDNQDFGSRAKAALYLLVAACAMVSALISVMQSFRALLPEVKRLGTRGDVFFGDIAARSLQAWERRVDTLNAQSIILDLTEQVHTTARIANSKHRRAQSAIRGAAWTLGFGLAAYALSIWLK